MVELDRDGLATAVRVARAFHRIPGYELAELVGVSPATICRVEGGKHEITASTLLALADWIGEDPREYAVRREVEA